MTVQILSGVSKRSVRDILFATECQSSELYARLSSSQNIAKQKCVHELNGTPIDNCDAANGTFTTNHSTNSKEV